MKFPSPAKDFITFQWPNDFTLAQIDQIRIAVAACESTGLGFVAWEIPTKAEVISTKVEKQKEGQRWVDVVDVTYYGKMKDGKAVDKGHLQHVTITGF